MVRTDAVWYSTARWAGGTADGAWWTSIVTTSPGAGTRWAAVELVVIPAFSPSRRHPATHLDAGSG